MDDEARATALAVLSKVFKKNEDGSYSDVKGNVIPGSVVEGFDLIPYYKEKLAEWKEVAIEELETSLKKEYRNRALELVTMSVNDEEETFLSPLTNEKVFIPADKPYVTVFEEKWEVKWKEAKENTQSLPVLPSKQTWKASWDALKYEGKKKRAESEYLLKVDTLRKQRQQTKGLMFFGSDSTSEESETTGEESERTADSEKTPNIPINTVANEVNELMNTEPTPTPVIKFQLENIEQRDILRQQLTPIMSFNLHSFINKLRNYVRMLRRMYVCLQMRKGVLTEITYAEYKEREADKYDIIVNQPFFNYKLDRQKTNERIFANLGILKEFRI